MRISGVFCLAALGGCLLCAPATVMAASASELYQEGLMKENAAGDLDAAIEVFGRIVAEQADSASVAARAQLHIGMCYEKLGREQAKEAYQKVIESFPTEMEVVQQARDRLQALQEAGKSRRPEIGAGPQKTAAVIQELDRQRERIQSCRTVLTTAMEVMGNPVSTRGTILFRRPDRLRMENTGPAPGSTSINVFDGKVNWTYQAQVNMVVKIETERIRSQFADYAVNNSLFGPFDGLDRQSVQYVRNASAGSEEVAVFQGNAAKSSQSALGPLQPAWAEVWVGVADGLLRKMVMYKENGDQMMAIEATVEAINPTIPDSAFVFVPPPGVQVMDMTDGVLSMLQKSRATETKGPGVGGGGPDDVQVIMREIDEKQKGIESLRARVTRQMQMMGTAMTMQTTEWRSGKRSRQETATSMPTMNSIAVNDGQVQWTYMPNMKMAQKVDMQKVREAQEGKDSTASGSFYGMAREKVKYVGRELLEGAAVQVFEGESYREPHERSQYQLERVKVWIGADDGLVRKMLGYDSSGKEVKTETRTGIETDLVLPDSLFVFTPPEGVQVMDLTDSAIKMARQAKAEAETQEKAGGK